LLATSTHDSKRSEDARARIAALTEVPDRWEQAVRRWSRFNRSRKQIVDGRRAPSRNDEYAFYQTLVAIWPAGTPGTTEPPGDSELLELSARLCEYLRKAAREAKAETSWINPNEPYEAALTGFVEAVLASAATHPFLLDFASFHAPVARLAVYHSIAQTLIKLTAPGVPDIYQGNELWTYALVDPDNRRPVDFALRERLLAPSAEPAELLSDWRSGRIKQHVVHHALALRHARPALFAGSYVSLETTGPHADRIVAFARKGLDEALITIVPRLVAPLLTGAEAPLPRPGTWADTHIVLPPDLRGSLHNPLTGTTIEPTPDGLAAADVLADLPVALLATTARAWASGC
jgi:(1->4)-alpha-D-glucan 1-alpha-D-glucosylmutase